MFTIKFANEDFVLHGSGAIYWPARNSLIVSDLHLEKGSYFATKGMPLPTYDTADTLRRLQDLIDLYTPQEVICLGDSIHDLDGLQRMNKDNYAKLYAMCQSVDRWQWVVGNHDKNIINHVLFQDFHCVPEIITEHLVLRHEPLIDFSPQMIGHFHPKMTLHKNNIKITGKCFIFSEQLFIMPAFGTYTGGLDIKSPAIQTLFDEKAYECYLLQKENVWRM